MNSSPPGPDASGRAKAAPGAHSATSSRSDPALTLPQELEALRAHHADHSRRSRMLDLRDSLAHARRFAASRLISALVLISALCGLAYLILER